MKTKCSTILLLVLALFLLTSNGIDGLKDPSPKAGVAAAAAAPWNCHPHHDCRDFECRRRCRSVESTCTIHGTDERGQLREFCCCIFNF
ncbi:hypothetical protein V2J09_018018 [Rumex salicifolius]